jgi:hypothetical protein
MSDARTGRTGRRWALAAALALALTFLWTNTPWAKTQGRVIYMASMEPREDPGSLPCGRRVPTEAGREWAWEVVTNLSSRGSIAALKGEPVTLEMIVGINGGVHPAAIPGLVDSFAVRRGQVTHVIFTAIKPDPHPITCTKHTPNMWGALVVVPE